MPSRNLTKVLFIAALCLALPACAPMPQTSIDAGDTQALAAGTYAWATLTDPGGGDLRIDNDVMQKRFRIAIDRALAKKGYRETAAAEAKMLVSYRVYLNDKTTYSVSGQSAPALGVPCKENGCTGNDAWGTSGAPTGGTARVIDYRDGTFVLELNAPDTGTLVWRGTSQGLVRPGDADQTQLNDFLTELTRQLPKAGAAVK